jgi:hypothetical protein
MFRTEGQLAYVEAACEFIGEALDSAKDGETSVDFDKISDEVAVASGKKPGFYCVEKTQQNRFTCTACGVWNDVLGRYAYCSACGTRNDLQELEGSVARIREQINAGSGHENSVRELVGAFESAARQYAKQLLARIPVSDRRRALLDGKPFHNLKGRAADLREVFDIDILAGMSPDDVQFAAMMFHRRHVYEHNGGEADEQYLRDSGDTSVQPKQLIRETRENAHRLATLLTKMTRNLHEGFHGLLPPQSMPIEMHAERSAYQKRNRRGP